MTGAAIAVVASYATGAAVLGFHLLAGRGEIRLRVARPEGRHFAAILGVGVPAALNVVQAQATMIVATGFAAAFGTAALAGYGAAARLDLLQIPLTFAMGSAVIAMVATSVGAGRMDRARMVAWTGAGLAVLIGGIFATVALAMPEGWMRLFSDDPAAISAGVDYLRRVGASYPVLGVGLGLFFSLLGLGRATAPFFAGTLRLIVLVLGGWAAVHWLDGDLRALALAMAAASLAYTLAMLVVAMTTKELRRARASPGA